MASLHHQIRGDYQSGHWIVFYVITKTPLKIRDMRRFIAKETGISTTIEHQRGVWKKGYEKPTYKISVPGSGIPVCLDIDRKGINSVLDAVRKMEDTIQEIRDRDKPLEWIDDEWKVETHA